jgi:CheY-like chemotaxis protein
LRQVSLRIGQSVHVLEDLFEGVLDIAHVEAGGMTIQQEPVCVQQLMDRALLLFSGEALDKGLSIKAMPCKYWVLGDRLALQRIVSNLVANAVRHTTHGRVLVGARRQDAKVRLLVLDTGPGIDAKGQERIFEEYYRLPTAQGHGFGLGLATVKRLCDAAAYPLGVDSTFGRGSTFWVELLLTSPPDTDAATTRLAPLADDAASLHILLVEDDPSVREALAHTLHSWGHVCLTAASGEEALARLRGAETPWSLMISDYNLPPDAYGNELNGLRLIEQVRQLVATDLPAVLMSGTLTDTLQQQALQNGCIALAKPVRPMHLRAVIDRIRANNPPDTAPKDFPT